MTVTTFEKRLKAINPKYHIKRYGNGVAGVFKGSRYLFRLPQGEIVPNTVYEMQESIEYGKSRWEARPVKRGRYELADLMHYHRHITWTERNKLAR